MVVEDDPILLQSLETELTSNGFEVLTASGEADLRKHLEAPRFHLVVLDLALDGAPYKGLDLVRPIRTLRNAPIVVITGHSEPWDRLRALEMGIDDYITKPFFLREAVIRIERLLNVYSAKTASAPPRNRIYDFAGFMLDPVRRKLEKKSGGAIDLTETEFNVLRILVYSSGRIVTRDELWMELRGQAWSPTDRALDGHVARLRAKLEPGVDRPDIIKSVRGLGYVLAVPVTINPHPQVA